MKKTIYRLLLVLFIATLTSCSNSEEKNKPEIMISAAVSLTDVLNELKEAYETENKNVRLTFNLGSSGKLANQIAQGAPVDMFLSASSKDMDAIATKGLIDESTRVEFASNSLVLITHKDHSTTVKSFEQIRPEEILHLAIGEPTSAPVGRYTKQVFDHLGLWDLLQSKLVMGSDARQVLTYVEMGNVDFAVVYSSDAVITDKVKVLAEADNGWHEAISYPGAIINDSLHKKEAKAFLDFLTSEEGKAVLQKYGFK
ncbi:molybdate ABC transporter substrate-binding protein [Sporosarcina sp. FSL W8-0480]|uniref:molybdate ABC transporter substrate-binding protein n=1 Tax=Sporosarcina sp. FSL W8-0480 TaxID=2954701 RepID=UPI0030D8A951